MKKMKLITNYRGGVLDEKVCKILFKYKGSQTIVIANEVPLNEMITVLEKTDEINILGGVEFIFHQLDSFDEKYKKGCDISEYELQTFGISVYLLTKMGILDNDENNGMVLFVE
jgi:hypothetical protein